MITKSCLKFVALLIVSFFLGGCQNSNFAKLKEDPASIFKLAIKPKFTRTITDENNRDVTPVSLDGMLGGSLADKNAGSDFLSVMIYALERDPAIISRRRDIDAKMASIGYTEAQKDFQVSSTIYGGIEDITDNTKGVAVSLNASRLLYDGGLVDAQVDAARFETEAARLDLLATIDQRALRLGRIWVELEKYQMLQDKIDSRLKILDPLIGQLEQVAKAGVGDVSKVKAAQRTVSTIRVSETNISEGLAQAQLNFSNAFGQLEQDVHYDTELVSKLVPDEITTNLMQKAPLLLSQYSNYKASVARVASIKAKDEFNVGFQAMATRPFAGSSRDSDEQIGFVARKTLFNNKLLESEIEGAEAQVAGAAAAIKASFREGMRTIETAQQNILSMDKAIFLAKKNAAITAEEIIYLRQQLVIGGSTLDSVLSAEARLYEAEANEVNFLAEKQKSQLTILSTLGLLSKELDI